MPQGRKLVRSATNRVIAGVCGGIGEYLNIDPTVIRIIAIFLPGFGLIAYLICAIIIPAE